MKPGREIDAAIDKIESEIRMLKMRVAELADEEPATVAAEPDDLHPVALKLAEAYRDGRNRADVSMKVLHSTRMAWCALTGVSEGASSDYILAYGLPK